MHGFIGERLQVAISNAKNLIDGLDKEYFLIDNNGRDDYLRNLTPIQQKCVQNNYGLDAIRKHLETYPEFIDEGGIYQIPKDFYDKLEKVWSLSKEEAGKLSNTDYKLWKASKDFFEKTGILPDQIEPMEVDYSEIQKGTYEQTIKNEEKEIKKKDKENRDAAYQESKPSFKEAGKAMAVSAGVEGGISFCMAIAQKHKSGKKLSEYTADDWKDVGIETGKGTAKGGIRGGVAYVMSNFTCTPANVANAIVTAVYGTVANAIKFSEGKMSEEDFIIQSEACCLDAGISTIAALIGEMVIPVPVLGAAVGTTVGNVLYDISKKYCDENARKCFEKYCTEINELNEKLDKKYKLFIESLEHELNKFMSILELAFDEQVNVAFDNSVLFAEMCGVDENRILKNKEQVDVFFLS